MVRFHFRGFVSILLSVAFLIATATGLVLWLAPTPQTFGIGKGIWKHTHIYVSLLMLMATVLHLWLNWSVYWGYLWRRTATRLNQKWELALALGIVAAITCVASLGGNNTDRFISMSIREIAERGGQSADQVIIALKEDGIAVHDPVDSLREIASYNNLSPGAVIGAVQRHIPAMPGGADGHAVH